MATTCIHHGITGRKLVDPSTEKQKNRACNTILSELHVPRDSGADPGRVRKRILLKNGLCSVDTGHGYCNYIKKSYPYIPQRRTIHNSV
jgi:hypothetical protein